MPRRALLFLRVAIPIAIGYFLFVRIAAHQSTMTDGAGWHAALRNATWPMALGMVALAGLNWGLESTKWRLLIKDVQRMGRMRAFGATLAGTAMGILTPNRSGEFVGRVLFLSAGDRSRGGIATMWGGMAQFMVTMVAGCVACLFWLPAGADGWIRSGTGLVCAVAVVGVPILGLFLFFDPRTLHRLLVRIPLLRRFEKDVSVLFTMPTRVHCSVLGLSALRYAVFTAQYVWMLVLLADVPWATGLVAVPFMFMVATVVPTMLLTDLGLRGSLAVALLVPVAHDPAPVLLSAFLLWAVNLAIPAVAGGIILASSSFRPRP